jgi:hypothetical protein
MLFGNPATKAEARAFRRMAALLIPFREPPDFSPTPEELAERIRLDAERARLQREIADIERRFPEMAARENARLARGEEEQIRREVFRKHGVEL